jgi:hypothetical protein
MWLLEGNSPELVPPAPAPRPWSLVWRDGDPLPAPGAGNDFISYEMLRTERGVEPVVVVSRALFGRLMSAVPEGVGQPG